MKGVFLCSSFSEGFVSLETNRKEGSQPPAKRVSANEDHQNFWLRRFYGREKVVATTTLRPKNP